MKNWQAILLLIFFISCEEESNLDLKGEDEVSIVIEALFTNELKQQEVKITKIFQNLNDVPEPVTSAIVIYVVEDHIELLTRHPDKTGVYQTRPFRALTGQYYGLGVRYNGVDYTAYAYSEPGEPLETLTISPVSDSLFEYHYTESRQPSMMEVYINSTGKEPQLHRFYTLDVLDVNQIFAPAKEPVTFPVGSQIVRRKYSLNEDHQEFLRAFLSEVDWRGGLFDIAPGNVPTNFTNGAKGYFAVSTVNIDTTSVD